VWRLKKVIPSDCLYGIWWSNEYHILAINDQLVVLTPLKNMSSSMGRMTTHILWKIKNVWNRQPVMV
jgi:hypothetical protein